eukprot:g42383.t1
MPEELNRYFALIFTVEDTSTISELLESQGTKVSVVAITKENVLGKLKDLKMDKGSSTLDGLHPSVLNEIVGGIDDLSGITGVREDHRGLDRLDEYDIYGFKTVPEDDEEEKLVAKVRALDLKSLSLTDSYEISVGVKWANYFASTVNREMVRTPELKNLIRWGVPHEHRLKYGRVD